MPIKIEKHAGYCDYCLEHKGTFVRPYGENKNDHTYSNNRDICASCALKCYELISNKNLINRTICMFSNIAKRLLDKKTKILIKAGYLSNDLKLTDSGEEALLSLMLETNMERLVSEAEEEIAEKEGEKE